MLTLKNSAGNTIAVCILYIFLINYHGSYSSFKSVRVVHIVVVLDGACNTHCHKGHLAHGNSKGGARERNRHKNNSKRVVRNLKERNVSTKGKSPKQGLTCAKHPTIELPTVRECPHHRRVTRLAHSLIYAPTPPRAYFILTLIKSRQNHVFHSGYL